MPEDYKGNLHPGSRVRVPVPNCRDKIIRVVVRVEEAEAPPQGLKMIGYTYGLKLIKLHKCAPRVLREMRLCREAGMTGDQIRPYWALGEKSYEKYGQFSKENRTAMTLMYPMRKYNWYLLPRYFWVYRKLYVSS